MTERHEKKDTQVSAHMSTSLRLWLKKKSERDLLSESEYIVNLIMADYQKTKEDFEFMKSLFDLDQ